MNKQANNFRLPVFLVALQLHSLSLHPWPLNHPHCLHRVKNPPNNQLQNPTVLLFKENSIYIISVEGRKESKSSLLNYRSIWYVGSFMLNYLSSSSPLKQWWRKIKPNLFFIEDIQESLKVDRSNVKQFALKLFCFFEAKCNSALVNNVSEYLSCFYRTLLSHSYCNLWTCYINRSVTFLIFRGGIKALKVYIYLVVLSFVVLSVIWSKILLLAELLLAESSIQFIENALWFIRWMLVLLVHISVVLQKRYTHFFPQVVETVMKIMICLLYLPKQ